jgi:L-lactate dehydrogenase
MVRMTGKIAVMSDRPIGQVVAQLCIQPAIAERVVICDLQRSNDIEDCRDATVVVMAVGKLDLLREFLPRVLVVAPEAVCLILARPIEAMTYAALKISGLPANRVVGVGTVASSDRFRELIAQRLKIAAAEVHAFIAGARESNELPLWSSATVATVPVHQWAVMGHGKLSVRDRTEIFLGAKEAGRSEETLALAAVSVIEAIVGDENRVLPVSAMLSGYQGGMIDDVCLSVPCIVNARGVDAFVPIALNDAEAAGLRNGAEAVREAVKALGL